MAAAVPVLVAVAVAVTVAIVVPVGINFELAESAGWKPQPANTSSNTNPQPTSHDKRRLSFPGRRRLPANNTPKTPMPALPKSIVIASFAKRRLIARAMLRFLLR